MPKGKCKFDQRLLQDGRYKLWLKPAKEDQYKAFCSLCKSSFSTEYGCESSVKSHSKGTLHKRLVDEKINASKSLLPLFFTSIAAKKKDESES